MTNIELQKELSKHPDELPVMMAVLADDPGSALGNVDCVIPKLNKGYLMLKEFVG